MDSIVTSNQLTHSGVMAMLQAAIRCAEQLGQPQCIVIVDASGVSLAEFRMTGAKFLSMDSARSKARTAASIGAPSSNIPEAVRLHIGLATDGQVTGLTGGLPVIHSGSVIGAVGIGSGAPEQDLAVAEAALSVLSGSVS